MLTASVTDVSSKAASNQPTTYTFSITPSMTIPKFSRITFTFPPTISMQTSQSQIQCTVTGGISTSSGATPTSTNPLTFTLTTVFNAGDYTNVGTAIFIACNNIVNPRNRLTTSSFTIAVSTKVG